MNKNFKIIIKDVNLYKNKRKELDSFSAIIKPGTVTFIIGDRGAGKSSAGLICSGLLKPDNGRITVTGASRISKISSYLPSTGFTYPGYPLYINITGLNRKFALLRKKELLKSAMELNDYFPDANLRKNVDSLNYTDQVISAFIRNSEESELIVADRLFEKINSTGKEYIFSRINKLKTQGSSFVLIGTQPDDYISICDNLIILKDGKTVFEGNPGEIDRISILRLCYSQINDPDSFIENDKFYRLFKYNEAVLQKLPVGLIISDSAGYIRHSNIFALQLYNEPQLAGLSIRQIVSSRIVNEVLSGDSNEDQNITETLSISGKKIIADIKISPVLDGNTRIGTILIIEDITEEELLRQQIFLSEKQKSVGLLAAGVAHEINNPLEIICNNLNYLKMITSNTEELETIKEISDEIDDITRIVSSLLDFSSVKEKSEEPGELISVLNSLIKLLKFSAEKQKIDIKLCKASDEIFVYPDKTALKQIFLNLFKNSFEALQNNPGTIDIKVSTPDKKYVTIEYTDSGPGISDNKLKNMFLPFYSEKNYISNQNTGLGLSIVYNLITSNDGIVEAVNKEDEGLKFIIKLSVADNS